MAELIADLFVSLDGFAGGVNTGAFFGYGGPELDKWVRDTLEQPQVIVMGRVTYEALAAMSMAATDEGSKRMNELPKVVVSQTLVEPLAWPNTRLLGGDLGARIRALKSGSPDPLRTIGSMALVSSMMKLGLVDLLRVTLFPLTLGPDGREPIYAGYARAGYDLAEARVLDSRLVMLEYRPSLGAGRSV
jgi:dihydrofolate reductase